jgi:hypothetical protein
MHFTVTYLPSEIDELARIWNQAPDRKAVTDAANEIDRLLKTSPLTVGLEEGPYRRLLVVPLEVVYRVSTEDCLVEVVQVLYFD